MKRCAGVYTGPLTHLDHLGPLCSILNIPLLIPDEVALETCRDVYPMVQSEFLPWESFSLADLAARYDMLLYCGKFATSLLAPGFDLFCNKPMRMVFCPHGNSDKGRSLTPQHFHPTQDIALVYGQHMIDLLTTTGAMNTIGTTLRTGNYRAMFYRDHLPHFQTLLQKHMRNRCAEAKITILYAPSWPDQENPSVFFDVAASLIENLPLHCHLCIKLHPFLEERYPASTYHLIGIYESHPRLTFLLHHPPVYPWLDYCDIYLGDFSSVGYDFLYFDKPMYFFATCRETPIATCGIIIEPEFYRNPYQILLDTFEDTRETLRQPRNQLYRYAFGAEVPPETLQKRLNALAVPEEESKKGLFA